MSDVGWRGRLPWHGQAPIGDSSDKEQLWAIGFAHLDLDAVQDIRCMPIDDDHPPPSLPIRYYAVDPEGTSLLGLRELAAVLYLPPGVERFRRSPRLGLAKRAEQALATFPAAYVVASQLDERRCWAQLRGTDPVLFTLHDSVTGDPSPDSAPTGDGPATSVVRVMPALLARYRISGGLGRPYLGHHLPMDEPIPVRVNGRLHEFRVSVADPAIAEQPDTLAPRPGNQARPARLAPSSWQHAETAVHGLMPMLMGDDVRGGGQRADRSVSNLCSLLTYAVSAETGQPPATIELSQLRYRLGETRWQEDAPLARARCRDWLYWGLWSAGHQIGPPPTTPPDELLYDPDHRRTALLERLAALDAGPDPRRDDPIVAAWTELTRAFAVYPEEHVYSDGTSDWSAPSWRVPFDQAWLTIVTRVDAVLMRRHGGWLAGTPVLVDDCGEDSDGAGRVDALTPADIQAPYWVFDHDRRAVTALAGYFIRTWRTMSLPTSDSRSEPVRASRIRLDPARRKGPSPA
jgi:hypothetical protein